MKPERAKAICVDRSGRVIAACGGKHYITGYLFVERLDHSCYDLVKGAVSYSKGTYWRKLQGPVLISGQNPRSLSLETFLTCTRWQHD